ncbi:hypothetical protein Tco_0533120 [Tanacetum coccineum]
MSSSSVTYTSISSDFDLPPWGFHLMDPDEFEALQSPEQASPSPDYVPGLEYPEYVAPSDNKIPVKDQPLHADASPTALSPGYVADFDPSEEDPEEDPEEYPADYPADGGDDDDDEEEESFEDDDEEEEASDEDEDEEEHLAPADSAPLPVIDPIPSAEETEPFETDESAATPPPPRSPQTRVLFCQTHLRKAQKTVRPQPPMAASTKALIAEYASASTPPSPPPSPLSPLSSLLPRIPSPPLLLPPPHTSPTYARAPLGYRAAMVQLRAASLLPVPSQPIPVPSPPLLLPSANRRSDILKTDMVFWKRLCLTTLASRFEVGKSLIDAVARQICNTLK